MKFYINTLDQPISVDLFGRGEIKVNAKATVELEEYIVGIINSLTSFPMLQEVIKNEKTLPILEKLESPSLEDMVDVKTPKKKG